MTQKRALAGMGQGTGRGTGRGMAWGGAWGREGHGGGAGHGAGHGVGQGMGRGIWPGALLWRPPEGSGVRLLQSCSRCQGISAAVRTEDSEGVASPGTRGGEKARSQSGLAGAPRHVVFSWSRRQAPSTVGSHPVCAH